VTHARHHRLFKIAVFAAGAFAVSACNVDVSRKSSVNGVKFVKRDPARRLGPDDVRIASQDSALEFAIIGDSIVAGFGAKVRAKLDRDLDTTKVDHDGIGGSIEKLVKGTVAQALDHDMTLPVSEISDVRYEDGFIRFYDKNGNRVNWFDNSKHDRDDEKTRFSEHDADVFINAFRSRKTKV
jgi:hypothetical protein